MHIPVFFKTLFMKAERDDQIRFLKEWIKKMQYVYIMEYDLTLKKIKLCRFQETRWTWR